ncbi:MULTISPECIES: group II intron reverse transcriptase/maturase [Syntrophotalea]|uniref:Group II intron reverse transcriptase/maturase n=3 Tax=Syntrophotalea TaxID=2812025 RepID=A0A1L3GHP0_SYNAC|nr:MULTISPECIES: group II intron reverse transcriptase/maturase [Syntrophotalea]APG25420.1 group II intron reverse transcriptase/maturase [Syntrophotalea acetylenica]APG28937.1 group II intron reverse transcriptase/maturase [Syntrophotalea acetylenivorans]APG43488.1 group II intron reverse transcriptase/maturase [Syntrophotalea acetylenica]
MPKAKPFEIPKRVVWEAWKRVAANKGAPGVDEKSIEAYRSCLGDNLYTLWNRMSSGSYYPQPVRQVLIPKGEGNFRPLGIPTVADRTAQMVVKMILEPRLERVFHPSSYGYRPKRSAKQAVAQARRNCWNHDWAIDLDIRAFFDTIDHELMMRAVEKHVPEKWIQLYIQRWLESEVELADGTIGTRNCGTPQGGVISPLLANLYLHYAFDHWMQRNHPAIPFERYADDVLCHCRSQKEAEALLEALRERLSDCRLELHPAKTKLVYCKDGKRRAKYAHTRFDFLGFSFHGRTVQDRRGNLFTGFNPAVSRKALKRMNQAVRDLKIHRRTSLTLQELAALLNPMVRGWVGYYGTFYPEPLRRFLVRLDLRLGRWARKKYKTLRRRKQRSWAWLKRCRKSSPRLFVHWEYLFS